MDEQSENSPTIYDEQIAKLRIESERFQFGDHEVKTRRGVQNFLELTINQICRGNLKRDQAASLAVFVPLAYKIATDFEKEGKPADITANITNIDRRQQIFVNLSAEKMDEYLLSDEAGKQKIIQDVEKSGLFKTKKAANGELKLEIKEVDPAKVRTKAADISAISQQTAHPITTDRARRLFGKNLADEQPLLADDIIDDSGFEHIFDSGDTSQPHRLRAELRDSNIPAASPLATTAKKLVFTCEWCRVEFPNKSKDPCPKAPLEVIESEA